MYPDNNDDVLTPFPITELLSKLGFIKKLEVGKKVNVRSMFVRDNNLLWQRFLRSIHNWFHDGDETKEATLKFIEKVTDETVNSINHYLKNPESCIYSKDICIMLLKNLEKSKEGTKTLLKTYEEDISFISRVEAYLDSLDIILLNLKNIVDANYDNFSATHKKNSFN